MNYTQQDFDRFIDEMWSQSGALLRSKGNEYASDMDRLGNFRRVAVATGLPMKKVALVWLMKHMDAISQGIQKGQPFVMTQENGAEGLRQRFTDVINYLLLLGAILDHETKE